jgi:hypothetical protein
MGFLSSTNKVYKRPADAEEKPGEAEKMLRVHYHTLIPKALEMVARLGV